MVVRTRTRVLERGDDGSVVTLSVLPGGLRVVTENIPSARSVSVGVWVGVGSVDETARLAGASHFLEHLLFKGTRTRTGQEIAVAIDAIGGELNAFTAHEYTCYYAHVLAGSADLAVALVCDVVLDAVVAGTDVDIERSVILEEIAMRDDDPEETLADAFAQAVFAGHPTAIPVIGNEQTITGMSRPQIAGYYRRRYTPERMVVAAAGRLDHAELVRWVRAAFEDRLDRQVQPAPARVGHGRYRSRPGTLVLARDMEQAHLSVGVPALARTDPRRPVLTVLSAALGGGMSSRLFRTIREERGLAYSCYASASAYSDVGAFSVYAGCAPESVGTVATLIGQELTAIASDGVTAAELDRVKGQLTGGFLLGLEDTESRMSRIGRTTLVRPEFRTVAGELAAIQEVTAADVAALAKELFARPLTGALVGPFESDAALPAELQSLTGAADSAALRGPGTRARTERRHRHVG